MSTFVPAAERKHAAGYVGVAFARTALGHHTGLVYHAGTAARIVHLAWHRTLKDQVVDGHTAYLTAPISLDPIESVALVGLLANVKQSAREMNYGFDWDSAEECFEPDGRLILFPIGKGLTCATFVYAVLRRLAIDVVDRSSWVSEPDDAEWQEQMCERLAGSRAPAEHVAEMRKDIGKCRLRPEQISGCAAAGAESWPVRHPTAKTLAAELLADTDQFLAGGRVTLLE